MSQKYRVAWRSKITGKTGHGKPALKYYAQEALVIARRQHPELEYWIEEINEATEDSKTEA